MSFHFFKEQSGEIGQEQFVEHLSEDMLDIDFGVLLIW